jgi:hypothetical protein
MAADVVGTPGDYLGMTVAVSVISEKCVESVFGLICCFEDI